MTVTRRKSSLSTVYIGVRWRSTVDLVAQPVAIALVPTSRALVTADWQTAAWETAAAVQTLNESTGEQTWTRTARLLAGPAATFNPAKNLYGVHARLTSNPEIPVLAPDELGYVEVS